MAHLLYAGHPSFRSAVDLCFDLLAKESESPLPAISHLCASAEPDLFHGMAGGLGLFVFQYALAEMLLSWGIRPAALMGVGAGEYAAACISGMLRLEEALPMVLGKGPPAADSSSAPCARRIPLVSTVTGDFPPPGFIFDRDYRDLQARNDPKFIEGIRLLRQRDCRIFIEIGADSALSALGRQHMPELLWLPCFDSGFDDWKQVLTVLGKLHTEGVQVDWKGFYKRRSLRKTALPTYPFQRDRYWFESSKDLQANGNRKIEREEAQRSPTLDSVRWLQVRLKPQRTKNPRNSFCAWPMRRRAGRATSWPNM